LGLGIFSGINQDKIRIETVATNRFRNHPIELNAPEKIEINNFLKPADDNFMITSGLGNSWCNLISLKIMRLIKTGSLHSQYSFLHIPKGFKWAKALSPIDKALMFI